MGHHPAYITLLHIVLMIICFEFKNNNLLTYCWVAFKYQGSVKYNDDTVMLIIFWKVVTRVFTQI